MIKIRFILMVLFSSIFLSSCSKLSPAGFWTKYEKEFIVNQNRDQGPWGGTSEVKWESKSNNYFNSTSLIQFADKNGWEIKDSLTFNKDTLKMKSISKLNNDHFSQDILKQKILKEIQKNSSKIYIFKTEWLLVEPGNSRETFLNGFAVIDSNRNKLKVYHFWGE